MSISAFGRIDGAMMQKAQKQSSIPSISLIQDDVFMDMAFGSSAESGGSSTVSRLREKVTIALLGALSLFGCTSEREEAQEGPLGDSAQKISIEGKDSALVRLADQANLWLETLQIAERVLDVRARILQDSSGWQELEKIAENAKLSGKELGELVSSSSCSLDEARLSEEDRSHALLQLRSERLGLYNSMMENTKSAAPLLVAALLEAHDAHIRNMKNTFRSQAENFFSPSEIDFIFEREYCLMIVDGISPDKANTQEEKQLLTEIKETLHQRLTEQSYMPGSTPEIVSVISGRDIFHPRKFTDGIENSDREYIDAREALDRALPNKVDNALERVGAALKDALQLLGQAAAEIAKEITIDKVEKLLTKHAPKLAGPFGVAVTAWDLLSSEQIACERDDVFSERLNQCISKEQARREAERQKGEESDDSSGDEGLGGGPDPTPNPEPTPDPEPPSPDPVPEPPEPQEPPDPPDPGPDPDPGPPITIGLIG